MCPSSEPSEGGRQDKSTEHLCKAPSGYFWDRSSRGNFFPEDAPSESIGYFLDRSSRGTFFPEDAPPSESIAAPD